MIEGRIRKTTTTNSTTFSPFVPRSSHRLCTPATCASNKTFTVDETLVFNYTNSQHDVAKVMKSAYDACNDVITLFTLIHVRDHCPPHDPFLPFHARRPQEVLARARLCNRTGIQPKPHFFQEAQLLASTLRGHNYVAPNWRRLPTIRVSTSRFTFLRHSTRTNPQPFPSLPCVTLFSHLLIASLPSVPSPKPPLTTAERTRLPPAWLWL